MKKINITKKQILGFIIVTHVGIFGSMIIFGNVWGRVKQPISFNHKIHAENDLECLDCHPYFQEHASSGKPSIETCSSCHEEAQGESKNEKKNS
jgi:hypothetical protein